MIKKGQAFDFLKTAVISPLALQHTWLFTHQKAHCASDDDYAQPTSFQPTLEHKAPREWGRSLKNMSCLTGATSVRAGRTALMEQST